MTNKNNNIVNRRSTVFLNRKLSNLGSNDLSNKKILPSLRHSLSVTKNPAPQTNDLLKYGFQDLSEERPQGKKFYRHN